MTRRLMWMGICALSLVLLLSGTAWATTVNGATATLEMRSTLTLSGGLTMTFVPGHGANGAYGYVYTDVSGAVQEDIDGENGWSDWLSYSASASSSNGSADGSVTARTAGFDYTIAADTTVEGLGLGDYGLGLGYAYAWPDWLRTDGTQAGETATLTVAYTYTLDTRDTVGDAEAYVYMCEFFADHASVNHLTAQGDWTIGYGSNPNTTIAEYGKSIGPGEYLSVTDSVSWVVSIEDLQEPNTWWSTWNYGEVGVELAPVPEPISMIFFGTGVVGVFGYVARKRMRSRN